MHALGPPRETGITFYTPGATPAWFWPDVIALASIAMAMLAVITAAWFLMKSRRRWIATYLIPALLMLGALVPWPYLYYEVLRLVTLGCLGYELFWSQPWRWTRRQVTLLAILLIYNPMIPLHLPKKIWIAVNIICAIVLFVEMFRLTRPLSAHEVDEVVSRLLQRPDHHR